MSDTVVKGKFEAPVDRARGAGDWRERGYSCDLFVDPPGREWNDFVHSTNELVTVCEGALELIIDGECHRAAPGDEILRDCPHCRQR